MGQEPVRLEKVTFKEVREQAMLFTGGRAFQAVQRS